MNRYYYFYCYFHFFILKNIHTICYIRGIALHFLFWIVAKPRKCHAKPRMCIFFNHICSKKWTYEVLKKKKDPAEPCSDCLWQIKSLPEFA